MNLMNIIRKFLRKQKMTGKSIRNCAAMVLIFALGGGCFTKNDAEIRLPNPAPPFATRSSVLGMPKLKEKDTMRIYSCGATQIKKYGVYCGSNRLVARTCNPLAWNLTVSAYNAGLPIMNICYHLGHWDDAAPSVSYDCAAKTVTVTRKTC